MEWFYGILGIIPGYLWPRRARDTAKKRWLRIVAVARCGTRLRRATELSRLQGERSRDVESLLPSPVNQSPNIALNEPIPSSGSSDPTFYSGGWEDDVTLLSPTAYTELAQNQPVLSSPNPAPNEPNPSSHASFFKISPDWLFSIANLLLEVLSEVLNQLSSKRRPYLGLVSMLMAFATLLVCIIELIYRGCQEKVAWGKSGMIYWFLHLNGSPFGTLNDVIALICSMLQCVFASIAYAFLNKHADDPIRLSYWPIVFASGLLCSKIYQRKSNSGTVTEPGTENPQ